LTFIKGSSVVTLTQGTTDNLMDYSSNTTATALYKYQWDYIHDPQTMLFAWAEEEEEGAMGILCFNQLESIVEKIRKANIDKKAEIELQLFSCYEDYQYNKVKFGKKEFSGVKISIKGYSRAFLEKDNNNDQIPSYNIKPSELCKQSYSDNGIKFVKYLFHELKYDIKNVPYDKKEPTGEVRIEISIKENEAKDFEDYLYAQETIEIEGIPYLSQLDKEDTKNKTGCETGCCWAASCWMINQTGTKINHNDRIYFADPINVNNLADGITTIITEQEFNEAVLYVKNQLQLGKPVLCGTWDNRTKEAYENGKLGPEAWNNKLSGSNNSATTHFVVIMGYGYDKSQDKYYFRFYDPGRSDLTQGTSENNKFYIDEVNLEIMNSSYRGKIYKVIEIRKNF